ncbi:hypothetical protein DICVIV_10844 [Dictyocaulus viviparus]|uniref:Uncharacterized protein n=1 Tax=Dictyocaulus viviparus TaxID=29172 RepID=A0A0D8XER8_DICVI|nr:hypothetical protein DICVIV_10844 [Dictyocaulus viviparus]
MMSMHSLLLLAFIVGFSSTAEDTNVKDNIAAGYFSPPQTDPNYGYGQPSYDQPSYQQYYQPQFSISPYALPTYDALLSTTDHDRHHHGPRVRKFERQSCRYSAVFSWESCNTCCKIASRTNINTNVYEIVGALFVFDPDMDFHRHDDKPDNSKHKELQCVCCAPKRH